MNNPNPFVPKGSILEQQSQRRSRLKLTVFCVVGVSVAGLAVMLIQGCKREVPVEPTDTPPPMIDTNPPAIMDTNPPAIIDTNPPAYIPPVMSNVPPAVVPPLPVELAGSQYTVVKGDIMETIAKKNGVTLKALKAANPEVVPTKLKIGQKLNIPAGGSVAPAAMGSSAAAASPGGEVYVVKSGDTLTKIAKQFGTTFKAIETENNLSTTKIKVGQKLKVPTHVGVAAPATPAPEPVPANPAPVYVPKTSSTN